MPLEIRELIIRTKIDESPDSHSESASSSGFSKSELIQECVEQMMMLLRAKEER